MTGINEKKQKLAEGKVSETLELVDTRDKEILYEVGQHKMKKNYIMAESVYRLLTELNLKR